VRSLAKPRMAMQGPAMNGSAGFDLAAECHRHGLIAHAPAFRLRPMSVGAPRLRLGDGLHSDTV
jgi:hypothetical protein